MDSEHVAYIVRYYTELLTGREQLLIKHAKSRLALSPETLGGLMKELNWTEPDADTSVFFNKDEPLRLTNENFDRLLATKIMEKHRNRVFLNYCPQCQRLARTPMARQCRCGYDWH